MKNLESLRNPSSCSKLFHRPKRRDGAIVVLAAALMVFMIAMLAFCIDFGYVVTVRTEAQRTVDAGALAGAGRLGEGPSQAIQTALNYTQTNYVGGDVVPESQIEIETGEWNTASRTFTASNEDPNAIRVFLRQDNRPLFFGRVFGNEQFSMSADAIATYRPRDIMLVLDYSASMNDDSELKNINDIGQPAVEQNLQDIYNELGAPVYGTLTWTPTSISGDNNAIIAALGLDLVPYPYPSGSWNDYVNYVKNNGYVNNAGYRNKYGYLTLVNYWLERKPAYSETPTLWMTSEQPITAVKDSVSVFLSYLEEVDTNDRVGLSVYTAADGTALLESELTTNFPIIEDISRQRQAGHYDRYTNIGAGMREARLELEQNGRIGALKMIVLMTDGIANRPNNAADARQYVLDEAQLAAAAGFPIVTVSLGAGADSGLMQQVADITLGFHFNIPGGQTVAQYEEELREVFREIAGDRPLALVD